MAHTIVINGVSYPSTPAIDVVTSGGTSVLYYDTSDATAEAAHILAGKKGYGPSGEVQGSIPSNGATGGTISTKAGTVTIPAGHTTGGTVSLASAAVSDCVAGSILSGKTILGVAGSLVVPTISQNSTTHVLSIR